MRFVYLSAYSCDKNRNLFSRIILERNQQYIFACLNLQKTSIALSIQLLFKLSKNKLHLSCITFQTYAYKRYLPN